jgi:hypothetical protein
MHFFAIFLDPVQLNSQRTWGRQYANQKTAQGFFEKKVKIFSEVQKTQKWLILLGFCAARTEEGRRSQKNRGEKIAKETEIGSGIGDAIEDRF